MAAQLILRTKIAAINAIKYPNGEFDKLKFSTNTYSCQPNKSIRPKLKLYNVHKPVFTTSLQCRQMHYSRTRLKVLEINKHFTNPIFSLSTKTFSTKIRHTQKKWNYHWLQGGVGGQLLSKSQWQEYLFFPIEIQVCHSHFDIKNRNNKKPKSDVTGREMINYFIVNVWPKNKPEVKKTVITALGILVTAKVLNVQVPFILNKAVNLMNESTGQVLTFSDPVSAVSTSVFAVILAFGITRASAAGFNELRNAVFAKVTQGSIRNIAQDLYSHLLNLDTEFHLNRQTGALSKTLDRGSRGINFIISALVLNIIPTIFEICLVSGILAYKCGWEFVLVTAVGIASYVTFTLVITQWRIKVRNKMNKAENEAGKRVIDSLINYETVKYFMNEKYEAEQYNVFLHEYEKASLKTARVLAASNWFQSVLFSVTLTTIMLLAARDIITGSLSVGELVLVNGMLFQLAVPLNFLGALYKEIRQALIDIQTMFSLMKETSSITNVAQPEFLSVEHKNFDIVFENVSFEYIPGCPVLKNLSFSVPTGKKVAIVGGSGSGKSTVVRLLFRSFERDSGTIRIGGKDIESLDLYNLRKHVAIVPQECNLFHNTIEYNIKYGDLNACIEEVVRAAKMAGIPESIDSWSNGYQTQVANRGLKLSGGEKQRVAIARAILKDAPILVFDEATSSLDSITEKSIMSAVKGATEGRTYICIAHRLSTVVGADEILVLNQGIVEERGTHLQLLQMNGIYTKLWKSQHE